MTDYVQQAVENWFAGHDSEMELIKDAAIQKMPKSLDEAIKAGIKKQEEADRRQNPE